MLLCMLKTSWESLHLQFAKSLKISGKGSVFEVIFPLGGKIQVIRKSSGGQAIMIMFCQCSLISQCYIIWIIGLWELSAGLLPPQVRSLFDKQGSDRVGDWKHPGGWNFSPFIRQCSIVAHWKHFFYCVLYLFTCFHLNCLS